MQTSQVIDLIAICYKFEYKVVHVLEKSVLEKGQRNKT